MAEREQRRLGHILSISYHTHPHTRKGILSDIIILQLSAGRTIEQNPHIYTVKKNCVVIIRVFFWNK